MLLSTAEFLPLLVFVFAGRVDGDLSLRFFWSAGAAVAIVPILVVLRWRFNPLLIAVNIWLWVEALTFVAHVPVLTEIRRTLAESAFFVAMIVVGSGYIARSERGLLTMAHDDRRLVRIYSLILLAMVAGGFACSVAFRGNETFSAFLPGTVIFIAQALMDASLRDRSAPK